jgi:hypothetical protein
MVSTGGAFAATLQAVSPATPLHGGGVDGPFMPRAARPSSTPAITGSALQQEAQSRIATNLGTNSAFSNDAAITQAEAQASGLGYVAQHFDEIDATHTGKVTLKQVQQYLQQQKP